MPTTPNYNIELVSTQMSQKEVVLNDAFITLDGVVYSLQEATAAAIAGNEAARDAILAAIAASEASVIAALDTIEVDLTPVAKTTELNAAEAAILGRIDTAETNLAADIAALPSPFLQGEVRQFRRSKVPASGWTAVSTPVPHFITTGSPKCVFDDTIVVSSGAKHVAWTAPGGTPYVFLISTSASTATTGDITRINMETGDIYTEAGVLPAATATAATSVHPRVSPQDGKIYLMYGTGQLFRITPSESSVVGSLVVETLTSTTAVATPSANEWYFTIANNGDLYARGGLQMRRWNFSANAWTNLAASSVSKSGRASFRLYCTTTYIVDVTSSTAYYIYDTVANTWGTVQAIATAIPGIQLSYLSKKVGGDDDYEIFMAPGGSSDALEIQISTTGVLTPVTRTIKTAGPITGLGGAIDQSAFIGEAEVGSRIPERAVHFGTLGNSRYFYWSPITSGDNLVFAEKD